MDPTNGSIRAILNSACQDLLFPQVLHLQPFVGKYLCKPLPCHDKQRGGGRLSHHLVLLELE